MSHANGIDPVRAHHARRRSPADAEWMPEGPSEGMLEATGPRLWLQIPGDPAVRARVTHVGRFAVRAGVPAPAAWRPRAGDALCDVRIAGRGFDHSFARARVSRARIRGGAVAVEVLIEPEAATSALWILYDQLRSGVDLSSTRPPAGWRPPKVPARGHYTEAARLERLAWITQETGADTSAIRATTLDASRLTGNVENLISGVEIPVGLAGPLWFNGQDVRGLVSAPFATTEGTLVASATRGATAITRAGGVTTQVVHQRMTRAPLFIFDDVQLASLFARWVRDHVEEIRREVQTVSDWTRLVELDPIQIGNQLHLRFVYETGDAAGQNMTTTCTWRACQWITARLQVLGLPLTRFYVEGQMSGDKKTNHLSFIAGRGVRVVAECHIDGATLLDVLKVTPEAMELCTHAVAAGALQTGTQGFDINVANTLAAMFAATGQDIACVHESSLAILSVRPRDGGLYASMTLPALVVGTVGGGTGLSQQRTYLDLLGCAGAGKLKRFAEIIAGYALALDLSTLAAVASGQFADSHERLGRNRPVEWFTRDDLTPELLQPMLARGFRDDDLEVTGVHDNASVDLGSSIITELTTRKAMRKLVGFTPLRVEVDRTVDGARTSEAVELMVKSKPLGDEVALALNHLASMCGGAVAFEYARWQQNLGFNQTHRKELHLATEPDPRIARIMPRVHGVHRDDAREAYLLVSEKLDGTVLLKDTADDVSGWELNHLEAAVRGIAGAHAVWLDRVDELQRGDWLGPVPSAALAADMIPLWEALADHARSEFPEWFDDDDLEALRQSIRDIPRWWGELETMPRTLIHNDFSPRNICLRVDPDAAGDLRLVAYDWELATIHVPQRDLAELLAFTLRSPIDQAMVDHLVELHRTALESESGQPLDPAEWRRGYALSLRDFMVQRVTLYLMGHSFRDYRFLGRVLNTTRALLAVEAARSDHEAPR